MGGCTITKTGKDPQEVVEEMVDDIEEGLHRYGLYPDSPLMLFNPETEESIIYRTEATKQYKIKLHKQEDDKVYSTAAKGAIAVSSHYGPKPEEGEWVATVHLHT